MEQYIIAIDQGTSSTKCIIFDDKGNEVCKFTEPLKTLYFEGGFVEQEPEAVYRNVLDAVKGCTDAFKNQSKDITSIKTCGISNQRETFILWDNQGRPLYNTVVWQCKRSVGVCAELEKAGMAGEVSDKTGLLINPYFSATKVIWLYQHIPAIKATIDASEAYFGTVDTWMLYKLTGGKQYLTDYTNASRTLFFNLHTLSWDNGLLKAFGLERLNLPALKVRRLIMGKQILTDYLLNRYRFRR